MSHSVAVRTRASGLLVAASVLCGSSVGAGLALPAGLAAQETITSDRPGIGSGSGIVESGVVQVETGLGLGGGPSSTDLSVGQLFVRVGVSAVELELFGNSYVVDLESGSGGGNSEGLQAAGLGMKVPVVRSDAVSLSLQGLALLPSGSATQGSDAWVFGLNALADFPVSERVAVNGNVGVLSGNGIDPAWSANVTPSYAFGGSVSAYAGWAGVFTSGADVNFAEAGLAFLANRNLQLDLNGGWSFDTDVWFLGGGLAIRWGAGPR
jgi:hypothetical protein